MAVLRLTSANLEFLKRELRLGYADIGSAHRVEGLAAACRYRSHAGQLAALRGEADALPVITIDAGRWVKRLAELGYASVPGDWLQVCVRSPQMPDPCRVEFHMRERGISERWFYRCRAESLPYITIEMARKYATLEWDCITVNSEHDALVREDSGHSIVDRLFATFQRISAGSGAKPYFCGTAFVGSIKSLRPDIAQTLADEFFVALYQASRPDTLAAA